MNPLKGKFYVFSKCNVKKTFTIRNQEIWTFNSNFSWFLSHKNTLKQKMWSSFIINRALLINKVIYKKVYFIKICSLFVYSALFSLKRFQNHC